MSDKFAEAEDWITSRDTTTKTIDRDDGPEIAIEVKDIKQDELEEIEDEAAKGPDAEAEAKREAIDEYLVRPDVSVDEIPMGKRNQLWFYMQLAWSGIDEVNAAMEDLEIPGNQGNR